MYVSVLTVCAYMMKLISPHAPLLIPMVAPFNPLRTRRNRSRTLSFPAILSSISRGIPLNREQLKIHNTK